LLAAEIWRCENTKSPVPPFVYGPAKDSKEGDGNDDECGVEELDDLVEMDKKVDWDVDDKVYAETDQILGYYGYTMSC
jgi:hypothetical protein